jgi:hypothetical protein
MTCNFFSATFPCSHMHQHACVHSNCRVARSKHLKLSMFESKQDWNLPDSLHLDGNTNIPVRKSTHVAWQKRKNIQQFLGSGDCLAHLTCLSNQKSLWSACLDWPDRQLVFVIFSCARALRALVPIKAQLRGNICGSKVTNTNHFFVLHLLVRIEYNICQCKTNNESI